MAVTYLGDGVYVGLDADTKPTTGVVTNALFFETDTGEISKYNGSSWDLINGRTKTETLTNKTLTSPIISTISNTGTLTLPTSTDTLVGRATTDTLTNKTISSGTVTGSLNLDSTSANYVEFVKTHTDASAEVLMKWRLDEATTSYISFENGTTTNASFVPTVFFRQLTTAAAPGGFFIGMIHASFDSGIVPVFRVDVRNQASGAIATRPLFGISNVNVDEYIFGITQADFKNNTVTGMSEMAGSVLSNKRWGQYQPASGTTAATVGRLEGILSQHTVTGAGTNTNTFDTTEGVLVNLATTTGVGENAGLVSPTGGVGVGRRLFGAKAKIRSKVDTVAGDVARFYFGFTSATALPISDAPLAVSDHGIIVGFNSTDTTYQIYHNDGATSVTKTAITGSVSRDTAFHTIEISWTASGNITVTFDGTAQTVSTDLPATTQNLFFNAVVQNVTGAARTHTIKGVWVEADK